MNIIKLIECLTSDEIIELKKILQIKNNKLNNILSFLVWADNNNKMYPSLYAAIEYWYENGVQNVEEINIKDLKKCRNIGEKRITEFISLRDEYLI